ncbi:TPA: helix-turn-helix transcriptional regulator [Clostridium perfringens]|uniref:helix-turn-helix domain-containing protein n=1 Tax=Clostridium perfringens TaxID=1502 RepID=UPI001CAFC770|nr:helix-turn-helix transcriptional regulator [Clostridium perfringens]MDU2781319.1 helix-turn-helix transcriptional regulator [Clostridium perfringens]UBK31873.1 helix-turn-helix domain-containing protein [Clostridium perfringens]HBI6224487.1 helix-turn-helix transcriptional regulator [Clostridium perfringens]HBI7062561.1 helix-turn-helix transcriptional regulator [Clostridium perfringens]HBI7065578.1 helix-turn-helix transcriptional regulator [Clostridium perfringens]
MEFNSLGNNIKKYRNQIGLTQKELGEKILKSEISIRKYESGKINIPPSTLFELCKIFNVTLGTLLGDDVNLYIKNNTKYEKDLLEILVSQTNDVINEQSNTISELYSATKEFIEFGNSWKEEHLRIITTPEGLLEAILDYLLTNDLYYTAMSFPEKNKPNDPELPYFKNSEIKNIIEKVCNLVITEIDKIESFNISVRRKTMQITKYILENNNIEFNKKAFEELYEKLENENEVSKNNNITPLPQKEKQIWEEGKEYLMPMASHDKEGDFTEEDYKHDDDLMNDEDLWK